MHEPFAPTHRLVVDRPGHPQAVVVLRLVPSELGSADGYAYTAAEWASEDSASWERRGGEWLLDGVPVLEGHPDRPAATSLRVERLVG